VNIFCKTIGALRITFTARKIYSFLLANGFMADAKDVRRASKIYLLTKDIDYALFKGCGFWGIDMLTNDEINLLGLKHRRIGEK